MSRARETVAQRRFTVEEYHRMAETGILGPDDRVELVRGVFREPDKRRYQVRSSLGDNSRVTPEAWPELNFEISAFLPRKSDTAE